jgi:hypothetical protein
MALALFTDIFFRSAFRSPGSGAFPPDLARSFKLSFNVFRRTLAGTAAGAAEEVVNVACWTDSKTDSLRALAAVRLRQFRQTGTARLTDMAMLIEQRRAIVDARQCWNRDCQFSNTRMPKLDRASPQPPGPADSYYHVTLCIPNTPIWLIEQLFYNAVPSDFQSLFHPRLLRLFHWSPSH